MDSPRGRPGRTPVSVKPIAAALSVALMGMGGVALAAPKADSTAPEQGNGPAPQAQANGPAPQAQNPAPPPQAKANGPAPQAQTHAPPPQAKAKGHQGAGKPTEVPPPAPTQGEGNPAPGSGQAGPGYHGRPAPGETRGQRRGASRGNCQSAACRGAVPKPEAGASGEQPLPVGGQQDPTGPTVGTAPGESKGRAHPDPGSDPGEHELGAPETETGSVLGANQGGGQEVEADTRSFDTALPFTGFEVVLLAGIGALLWLVGVRLRRSTA
jgi:hypothetical protein